MPSPLASALPNSTELGFYTHQPLGICCRHSSLCRIRKKSAEGATMLPKELWPLQAHDSPPRGPQS